MRRNAREIMKMKRNIFAAAMAVTFAAFSPVVFPNVPEIGMVVCEASVTYENDGLKLIVPEMYDNQFKTDVPQDDPNGKLFTVTEKASMEAARMQDGYAGEAGWLFTIMRVEEPFLHKSLCGIMVGDDVFAKDTNGNYYVFCHPTDVRFVRNDIEEMRRDQQLWSDMNAWANGDVKADFIKNNAGLMDVTYDNSVLSMYLARTAYMHDTQYTLSTTQYGPLSPNGVEASSYVERLICNASYEVVDADQTPDGEYVVLNLPGENIRFDFFKLSGSENYVREVREDGSEILYKASFKDDTIKAANVMQEWYDALAAAR